MPAWTKKDESQYEHIRDASLERGLSEKRSKEIAARTVNKHRRSEGRTANVPSQGTGNPKSSLSTRSLKELKNIASQLKINGRSKMNKSALIDSIRQKRTRH